MYLTVPERRRPIPIFQGSFNPRTWTPVSSLSPTLEPPPPEPALKISVKWSAAEVAPLTSASAEVVLKNCGYQSVGIVGFGLVPRWGREPLASNEVVTIPPGERKTLGTLDVPVPSVVGPWSFEAVLRVTQLDAWGNWSPVRPVRTKPGFPLLVRPQPTIDIFLSRGIGPEDRAFGDPVAKLISWYGFNPRTVGINDAGNPSNVNPAVVELAKQCVGLVGLGLPRERLAGGGFAPSAWLPAESGMALGNDKPILTIHDERVGVRGPAEREPRRSYRAGNLEDAFRVVRETMPGFRDRCLDAQSRASAESTATTVGYVVGAAALVGLGYLIAPKPEPAGRVRGRTRTR